MICYKNAQSLFSVDRTNPLEEQNMDDNEVEVFQPENQKVWNQIDKEFAKMIEQNEEEESRQTNPNLLNIVRALHMFSRILNFLFVIASSIFFYLFSKNNSYIGIL